jgi:hypothetical protein
MAPAPAAIAKRAVAPTASTATNTIDHNPARCMLNLP